MMVVSQWTAMSRVVVKQQTNICPQVISAQQIDSGLMAVLQRTTVTNRRTYLIPQATSAQQTDFDMMDVVQQTTMLRVVVRPQANTNPITKNSHPCQQNTPRLGGNTGHTPERREVKMMFEGPREVGNGQETDTHKR